MNKKIIAKELLTVAKELCADFEEDLAKQEKFQRWQMSEYEKLSKEFGNIKVDFDIGTTNPLRVDIGRERFKFDEFQSYVERKLKETENLKKLFNIARASKGKLTRLLLLILINLTVDREHFHEQKTCCKRAFDDCERFDCYKTSIYLGRIPGMGY